ncbi:DNA cross-link repair 1A protein [Polymixia lowei]
MSHNDDSENDIWEYTPLKKKKKRQGPPSTRGSVSKSKCTLKTNAKRGASYRVEAPVGNVTQSKAAEIADVSNSSLNILSQYTEGHNRLESEPSPADVETGDAEERPSSGVSCPICQMPFSILVVQSQRWHVAECLETPRDKIQECPDGLQCSSTIPNHYKRYNHTLLAHCRATNDTDLFCLSQGVETSGETSLSCLPEPVSHEVVGSILESSQDSAVSISGLSNHSASSVNNHSVTTQTKLKNSLLLLRSPGPEDFKKKKGWLPSAKGQKSTSSSQESKIELTSTPIKSDNGTQAFEGGFVKIEQSPYNDDSISYSPLSEIPAEIEVNEREPRKSLFPITTSEQDSTVLFSDAFSSDDELFSDFIDQLETNNVLVREHASAHSKTQLESVISLVPCNQLASSTAGENTPNSTSGKEVNGKPAEAISSYQSSIKTSIQSPQSIVLECLRETLSSQNNLHCKSLNDSGAQTEQDGALQPLSTQTSIPLTSQAMAPRKGQSKAGQASSLKQLDIGVFFGLKPLKEKQEEVESGPRELGTTPDPPSGEKSRRRRERGGRQRKGRAATTTDTSNDIGTAGDSNVASARGETGRGWRRGGRRRWNRGTMYGELEEPMHCPFYKKIPGTKFAIDAFHYGEIEGISAYFLTHFHSDHYGGLKKNSTFPIYCNRITGNLVKSKLKVAEQYVHILPMNTRVTVEGVGVILLDANHCPGAAMLLFFLPDGQTVLHTGDFRADPSMETYPELLNCRVQTLYLDTTYCSPEYTFPSQQDVIGFAANTAFELVTLNPRTLVVCGSYSVGKEKVFLTLAEILGSKVCLSRDKYATMCCLESERVARLITTDWKAARVHVLPMMQLRFNNLQAHLSRFSGQYDQLVAFKPTGWTFSQQVESVEDIQPQTSGNIAIYGIPYSEHSSFLEMKRFVQWLQPLKIIPTVNTGNRSSRRAMEKCFHEWLMESKAKP